MPFGPQLIYSPLLLILLIPTGPLREAQPQVWVPDRTKGPSSRPQFCLHSSSYPAQDVKYKAMSHGAPTEHPQSTYIEPTKHPQHTYGGPMEHLGYPQSIHRAPQTVL